MKLFRRVGDILSANLNELVDQFENPETMLKQAIREMESAIAAAMDGAAKVIATEKLLAQQQARHAEQATVWKRRARQAVDTGDDGRARQALSRKQEHDKLIAALGDQLVATQSGSRMLRRQIDAMHIKLREAQRKFTTLAARHQAARARETLLAGAARLDVGTSSFGRFERMCAEVEQAEARTDALCELAGLQIDDEGFAEAELDLTIEAQLAVLKREAANVKS